MVYVLCTTLLEVLRNIAEAEAAAETEAEYLLRIAWTGALQVRYYMYIKHTTTKPLNDL